MTPIPAARIAARSGQRDSKRARMVIRADLGGKSLRSRPNSLPDDATVFRIYWVRFGGKRGALTRTAEEVGCSLTHVARVLSRHAPKAIPRGSPVQAVSFDLTVDTYVTPTPPISVAGLTYAKVRDDARLAADVWLGIFIVVTWLAVCLVWVPGVNALLGVGALVAGSVAAGMGRVYYQAKQEYPP